MHLPSTVSITGPFQSKEAFLEALKTTEHHGEGLKVGNARWSNKEYEMRPSMVSLY